VRNKPQQIQDIGVHCVHPGLPKTIIVNTTDFMKIVLGFPLGWDEE
jgi:hypothetical protein